MESNINNEEVIRNKLVEIINSLFNVDINDSLFNKPLLGRQIKLAARDLVYLYFEVKKVFNIEISEDAIISGKFITVNSIADYINSVKAEEKVY